MKGWMERWRARGETEEQPSPQFLQLLLLSACRHTHQTEVPGHKEAAAGMALALGGAGALTGAPSRTSPKIFTFDRLNPNLIPSLLSSVPQKKKRRRRKRVCFPTEGPSTACTFCLNRLCPDDHVLRYDLEGLEKTLRREVFGQQGAVEGLLYHLKDYLSTYVHNKPLVVSLHGPSGVGKSHLGRLLAGHFRSVVGEALVLQYYVLHHCPQEADALQCGRNLTNLISAMVERAEEEEKIPLFIFDEAEHMHSDILDALWQLVTSKRSNEYLNAIYLFLSNLGHVMTASGRHSNLVKELTPILRGTLEKLHPLWAEVDILALGLLEKGHVMECFLDEMTREGFYPDHTNMERLAGEIEYYPAVGGREYSQTGCKQVVAKVNLL
uniref:Torsin family 4, member Aa n=1 Tax=Amphiprion percula TaxID=161767 RepID=A0A3P8SQM3_AMPPE